MRLTSMPDRVNKGSDRELRGDDSMNWLRSRFIHEKHRDPLSKSKHNSGALRRLGSTLRTTSRAEITHEHFRYVETKTEQSVPAVDRV
jgi:hypothetical protein